MSDKERSAAGFYGKLPSLGDFVNRRLPPQLIQPWDQWLRECMAASQAQLGEGWLDTYLTSPLWRFVLTPGIAGQGGWAGVLMPSVDRVGRYFPLTLATPLADDANPFRVLERADWFDRAEQLALSGLDDGFDLDAFDAEVGALAALEARPERPPEGTSGGGADAWQLPIPSPDRLGDACPQLLAVALEDIFFAYSLWCSAGSDRVAPSILACQGLPPPEGYAALLTGRWSKGSWRTLG